MKRKISKRITGFCLLILVTLSLCGCTGNAGESRKENENLAKEYVYRFQEVAMPELGGDENFDEIENINQARNFNEVEMEPSFEPCLSTAETAS